MNNLVNLRLSHRNEPHDLPQGVALWAQSVQAAVNAIRAAGATSQIILIPGSSYSSAQALPNEAGPALLNVTDPAGGVNKLVFDGDSPCLLLSEYFMLISLHSSQISRLG